MEVTAVRSIQGNWRWIEWMSLKYAWYIVETMYFYRSMKYIDIHSPYPDNPAYFT